MTLVVLALACGSTLPLAERAEAEPAATCVAKLNAARRSAGLPAVANSATLSKAAQRHANYRAYNDARGLRDTSAHYETKGRAWYSGVRPWDRTKAAGLRDGTWARQGENVVTGYGSSVSLQGIDSWLAAPYHRFPVLDANMRTVGCANSAASASSTRAAEVLEMVWPWTAKTQTITTWPLNNQRSVATSFDRRTEAPSPFRSAGGNVVGSVVSLQASGYANLRLTATPTLKKGTTTVPVYASSPAGDTYLPGNAVMFAAKSPLQAATRYTATVKGQVRTSGGAWKSFSRTWSFTTR
jgi:uncharacterized protein YkwD